MILAIFVFDSSKDVMKLNPKTLLEKSQLVNMFPFPLWSTRFHCHANKSCQILIHFVCASVSFTVGLCVSLTGYVA